MAERHHRRDERGPRHADFACSQKTPLSGKQPRDGRPKDKLGPPAVVTSMRLSITVPTTWNPSPWPRVRFIRLCRRCVTRFRCSEFPATQLSPHTQKPRRFFPEGASRTEEAEVVELVQQVVARC